ncbi:MAG: PP2C family protein-serine/threonine phosphatase, partial [Bacteroidia bacterium]
MFIKRWKDNYITNWKEKDNFEKYGIIAFLTIVLGSVFLVPKSKHEKFAPYLFVWCYVFMALMFNRIKKSKQQVVYKNKEIELQKRLIEVHQKEIIDSITYAKRIQDAILPPDDFIKAKLPDTFVLYKPKDIVAGDFYWMEQVNDTIIIAAADCTGHGVPGAMVSVVCSNALNRAVKEFNLSNTGAILDKATDLVIETFEKSPDMVQDGMDISLLSINKVNHQIQWSGANNPLWYFNEAELKAISADKQPIGT